MNDPHDESDLPDLSDDDDVRLLYAICQRASTSSDPPFKALFAAYDAILKEEDIQQQYDGVIFRALLRVGESTAEANKQRQHVDLVERLENLLEARGITLIRDDGQEEDTGLLLHVEQPTKRNRRVSFDDARLEETWLSEHSEALNPPLPPAQPPHSLLSLPPRRARNANSGRRARSTSSQRSVVRRPAPKLFQTSSSRGGLSENGDVQNPTLHFEVSQTQLEINAVAMLAVSEVRLQRRTLHFLHDQFLQLQTVHKQACETAIVHDRRILQKQALETWRGAMQEQRYERRHEQHFQHLERKAERARDLFLITKAFTHWATQCSDERFRTRIAQHYVLRAKYFKRWRTIAIENHTKMRRILCRKYVAIWREKTARRALSEEYAQAWYEERLMRRCKFSMFWEFCSRQVVDNHDAWIKRRALTQLREKTRARQEHLQQADQMAKTQKARRTLYALSRSLDSLQQDSAVAFHHHERIVVRGAFQSVRVDLKLAPRARDLTLKVNLNLLRKAFTIWHRNVEMEHQADTLGRRLLLLWGFRSVDEEWRCRRMLKYRDERIQHDALYRWVIQAKSQVYRKKLNAKLAMRVLDHWREKVSQERNQLEYAQAVFAEAQHRRRQRSGMVALNLAKRRREDAERAAIEFRNSRDLPPAFAVLREKHELLQKLERRAPIIHFYHLTKRTLRVWSERTTEHKANRRRNAYAHVRARIKIRLVGACFEHWHGKTMHIRAMDGEAARRAASRVEGTEAGTLTKWREETARIGQLDAQATSVDQDRLLRSAFGALLAQTSEKVVLQQRLAQSNRATDLALLASALRRLDWRAFRAARNRESAEALRDRNADTHMKQMLRHWADRTAARRLPPQPADAAGEGQEPESPSLRPASRAASRASATTTPAAALPSSPPQRTGGLPDSTPGYMRTPSRTRRTGRFRPLPTPAAITPFALDPGYLTTTPAPLQSSAPSGVESLTPQVTPFARKLRAGGFGNAGVGGSVMPPSALRGSVFAGGAATGGGTGKSVRFAGSGGRFGRLKSS